MDGHGIIIHKYEMEIIIMTIQDLIHNNPIIIHNMEMGLSFIPSNSLRLKHQWNQTSPIFWMPWKPHWAKALPPDRLAGATRGVEQKSLVVLDFMAF